LNKILTILFLFKISFGQVVHKNTTAQIAFKQINNIIVNNSTSTKVDVKWDDCYSDAFVIQYKDVDSFNWKTKTILNNYTSLNLLPNKNYQTRIKGMYTNGVAKYSTINFSTKKPTGLQFYDIDTVNTWVSFKWDEKPNYNYSLEIQNTDGNWFEAAVTNENKFRLTVIIKNNLTYKARLRYIINGGYSLYSDEIKFIIK
jgi:hypothetical protein